VAYALLIIGGSMQPGLAQERRASMALHFFACCIEASYVLKSEPHRFTHGILQVPSCSVGSSSKGTITLSICFCFQCAATPFYPLKLEDLQTSPCGLKGQVYVSESGGRKGVSCVLRRHRVRLLRYGDCEVRFVKVKRSHCTPHRDHDYGDAT
jgi:hypothetical protein